MTSFTLTEPKSAVVQESGAGRIASLDVCRGIAVVLMIFTDQFEGLPATPSWLRHSPLSAMDAMTIRDFGPAAFLFMVGVSIPVVLERQQAREVPVGIILWHIVVRTLVLSLIGLIMANAYHWSVGSDNLPRVIPAGWPIGLWDSLLWLSTAVALNRSPKVAGSRNLVANAIRGCGMAAVLVLWGIAAKMPGEESRIQHPFTSVLGTIAVAYLLGSLLALGFRRDRSLIIGAMVLALSGYLVSREALYAGNESMWVPFGVLFASYVFICFAGIFAWSLTFSKDRDPDGPCRVQQLIAFAVFLAVEAVILHRLQGINRMEASPTWALACTSVGCLILVLFHCLVDLQGLTGWARPLAAVGKNALVAYMLPWFLWSIANLFHLPRLADVVGPNLLVGGVACGVYTMLVVGLAVALPKIGFSIRA